MVPATAVAGAPDATIDFEARQVRLLLGGGAGSGILRFKGKDYPFTMKAATVGGVGVTDVAGTGSVHGLTKVEDFAGTYAAIGIGAALVKGKGASAFRNSKSVIVTTKSKSSGVALNLGAGGVTVTFDK
ncbi:MAG: hypothetical protein H7Z19_10785 [Chitinophagaceae bacterium]|nr:hypothetical protein [Rubrivivax sp.]